MSLVILRLLFESLQFFLVNGVLKEYALFNFIKGVLGHNESKYLGQKCGMDQEDAVAIDLRGNVITCQNVSAVETGHNGQSHFGGVVEDMDNVSIKTATHWQNRPDCAKCPVLHICQGSCMFLDGDNWTTSCNNSYSDTISYFALGIEKITGYIPTLIKNDELPLERQDIFGTIYKHEEKTKKKIIPIKVVSEKVTVIDDVEVYGKSRVIDGTLQ